MIVAHDTYTYQNAKNAAVQQISQYWRCQKKSIPELYKSGVRGFDIRIKEETANGKTKWRTCHGAAEFDYCFASLKTMFNMFSKMYPGVKIRVILEKGDDSLFRSQMATLIPQYQNILIAVHIKKDMEVLYKDESLNHYDYACHIWDDQASILDNVTGLIGLSIEEYAYKNNPTVTQEMIDDPVNLYFLDFC